MTDQELFRLYQMLKKPVPWDPVPFWLRLNEDQLHKFNEIQQRFNTKISQIEAEKMQELGKIAGLAVK